MKQTKAEYLPVEKLCPFEGHPFQIRDDEEMDQLVWSVLTQGILTPIVVRPLDTGQYEVISGHRRVHACKKAGIERIPALIYNLDRDAAAIALVDSNLHRERILPSEKAFAYKLKMDALSHQGQRTDLTSRQVVGKLETADLISENESGRQVQRYIRLTNLIPEILHMVDEGRIALTPAVELSYLNEQEQQFMQSAMYSYLPIEEELRDQFDAEYVRHSMNATGDRWLICWDSRIVNLRASWELTEEQIDIIVEQLKP